MKIEEAIVYALATRNGGMTTEQIADTNFNSLLCRQTFRISENGCSTVPIHLFHPLKDEKRKAKGRKSPDDIVTII